MFNSEIEFDLSNLFFKFFDGNERQTGKQMLSFGVYDEFLKADCTIRSQVFKIIL